MTNDLISIVVPVYNTGCYLEKCIHSILEQSYPHIEIIIIDDGSDDDTTSSICDDIASRSNNISVYHQKNNGSASARNLGIEKSHGKYIGFIDSDDYIEKDMYSNLVNNLKKYNLSLALSAMHIHESHKDYFEYSNVRDGIINQREIYHLFLLGFWHSACTNLYEKELLNTVRFPEHEINEDFLFNYTVIKEIETAWVDSTPYYHYIRRKGSNTSSNIDWRIKDWIKHNSYILKDITISYPIYGLYDEAYFNSLRTYIIIANKALLTYSLSNNKRTNSLIYYFASRQLKKKTKLYICNDYLSHKYKIMALLISIFPYLYKEAILLYIRVKRMSVWKDWCHLLGS